MIACQKILQDFGGLSRESSANLTVEYPAVREFRQFQLVGLLAQDLLVSD